MTTKLSILLSMKKKYILYILWSYEDFVLRYMVNSATGSLGESHGWLEYLYKTAVLRLPVNSKFPFEIGKLISPVRHI